MLVAIMPLMTVSAAKYDYTFNNTPVSEALVRIGRDHHDLRLSFIYAELDNYRTTARVSTDDAYTAVRSIVGVNPISVICKGNNIYVEALQHGRYSYFGRLSGRDGEPVAAATVMLLNPNDSTVITYGVTDGGGRFQIPCDHAGVVAKMTCLGYRTKYQQLQCFNVGDVVMEEYPVNLGTVTVTADYARLYADKSVYLPTNKQKNASQTAQDLINRMAIPQLRTGEKIMTANGQPVEMFIDFVPAGDNELTGVNPDDVRRVEYYDYPSDPRFQGKAHVINFILQKYEYGGYVKGLYYDNFVLSRQFNGYAKFAYKRMTFDWAGGLFYMDDRKTYDDTRETFRLPQLDGSIKEFVRTSTVDESKRRKNGSWTSMKALYRTDNVTLSNMITADFDHAPRYYTAGSVTYTPEDFKSTEYSSQSSNRINSLVYSGYWYATLPHGNSITFNPHYAYTHTNQTSTYDEVGLDAIVNGAVDNSHQASGDIAFTHSFGQVGTLKAMCQGRFLQNRTCYSGSSSVSDRSRTYRVGPGVNYSYSDDKFYGTAGVGLHWDKSEYGSISESSTAPWANASLQYAFNIRNSISIDFKYGKSIPSSSYRSAAVIQSYPLMSYTGNPALVPFNSYEIEGSYMLIPNNRFSFSAFGSAWIVDNRYVYDYEANSTGVIRTIKQPLGGYSQWQYGVQGSGRFFDNKLQFGATCYVDHVHNGAPYNWTKSKLTASVAAYYYLDNVYFGATYTSPEGYADGCMVGIWLALRDSYTFQVGWSDKHWNLRLYARNFFRYGSYRGTGTMNSTYYDSERYIYSSSFSGFFQVSATYTFGFGKKVSAENEAYQASGAASGILK